MTGDQLRAEELAEIMREARELVARSDNFIWSSWEDREEALAELDEVLTNLRRGDAPRSTMRVLFAPTGPLQEVAISSGWGDRFLALADRFDRTAEPGPTCTKRVVSLLPAATEVVCWLGAFENLCGISHECDYPESVKSKPVLTRSRIDIRRSSGAIDTDVRNVLSIYEVDEEQLAKRAPDVIITQDLCAVCAVSLEDVRCAVAKMSGRERVEIVSLRPTRLIHVFEDLERIGAALGVAADGRMLRTLLEGRMRAIAVRAAYVEERPRVVAIEWLEPLMIGGTWMPELIDIAGGTPLAVEAGQPARTVTSAELTALDPEVVIVKPCGFTLARALEERAAIERDVLRAVPNARVYVSDGNAFFNRPGPRLVESLEIMAACIHPARFEDLARKHDGAIARLRG